MPGAVVRGALTPEITLNLRKLPACGHFRVRYSDVNLVKNSNDTPNPTETRNDEFSLVSRIKSIWNLSKTSQK